ncbi:MAG TPA: ABC transporter ATP-binding protein, partial [Acidimicrobiales bacterium]|nr:ABC transporter ATP-binding protein [Acidimicrobiales bacterium]
NEIGMIFQDPMTSLNPTMNIGRQIAESVVLHKQVSRRAGLDRAAEVLNLVGMPNPKERLNDYPHQLSGGLRQRVMIAMALACEPKLLIADEPTTALDVTIQAQILALLNDLKFRLGMAILLITHDMGVIAEHTDRTMVMYAGKVVESAQTDKLFDEVHHPYTEALLASIPQMDQDKTQRLYAIPGIPPDLSRPLVACRFNPRCRYASEQCRTEEPVLGGSDLSHPYACFHPVDRSVEEIAGAGDLIEKAGAAALVATVPASAVSTISDVDPVLASNEAGLLVGSLGPSPEGEAGAGLREGADGHGDRPKQAPQVPNPDKAPAVAAPVASVVSAVEATWPASDAPVILELRGVRKDYPVTAGAVLQRKIGAIRAVRGIDLTLRQGETLGVVGESGCGKSTLGRLIVSLEPPTTGSVLFEGADLTKLKGTDFRHRHRDLTLMFQDPYSSLDPRMRVGSIIREPLVVQGIGTAEEQRERVAALLREVGLAPHAVELYPHEFSGGQRQRIGLARALALNPRLIVADEPVSALDVSIRSQILNLMKRLQAAHGLTYVFISHDLSVVRYLADRIAVMYLGKLVEIGTGDDIYARPAHPYTAGLIGSVPVPNPALQKSRTKIPIRGELPSPLNPPSGCPFRTRCPNAQSRCAEEEPALTSFGGEHFAACYYPTQQPVEAKVSVPAA